MATSNAEITITDDIIMSKILVIHGQKVMIDRDMAELYGVTTKRLNEQVTRNGLRFPDDFMFQLTDEEKNEVVAKCDHLWIIQYVTRYFLERIFSVQKVRAYLKDYLKTNYQPYLSQLFAIHG